MCTTYLRRPRTRDAIYKPSYMYGGATVAILAVLHTAQDHNLPSHKTLTYSVVDNIVGHVRHQHRDTISQQPLLLLLLLLLHQYTTRRPSKNSQTMMSPSEGNPKLSHVHCCTRLYDKKAGNKNQDENSFEPNIFSTVRAYLQGPQRGKKGHSARAGKGGGQITRASVYMSLVQEGGVPNKCQFL